MKSSFSEIDFTDYGGLFAMLLLMLAGAVTLHSAAGGQSAFLYKQLVWYGVGLVLMVIVSSIDYRAIGSLAFPVYVLMLLGLGAVLIVGHSGGGSQRWLGVGAVKIQPSEFAKIGLILAMAQWCTLHPRLGGAKLVELFIPGMAIGCVAVLVMLQPDLGTTLAITAEAFAVLLIAGIHRRVLIFFSATGIAGAVAAWFFVLKPYQKKRVFGFLNPEADPLGIGYHTIQSKIAIGLGGVRGTGFGEGSQTKLRFLPEQHTDFIFSVWSEEWGFLGVCAVLAIFLWLLFWIAKTAMEAKDPLGRFLAGGILAHFMIHIGLNLAMVVGWAPVVGLPLPWMTYGGSAVFVNCIAMGIVISVRRRRRVY